MTSGEGTVNLTIMRIEKLSNPVQHYSWGTTDFIPGFLGLENKDKKPFAELWMGDHIRELHLLLSKMRKFPLLIS